jgi:hypothetical protein
LWFLLGRGFLLLALGEFQIARRKGTFILFDERPPDVGATEFEPAIS